MSRLSKIAVCLLVLGALASSGWAQSDKNTDHLTPALREYFARTEEVDAMVMVALRATICGFRPHDWWEQINQEAWDYKIRLQQTLGIHTAAELAAIRAKARAQTPGAMNCESIPAILGGIDYFAATLPSRR